MTAMPVRMVHVWHSLVYVLLYVLFSFVYPRAGGTDSRGDPFIYSQLDWNKPATAAIYSALGLAGMLAVWVFIYVLYTIRIFIYYMIYKVEPETRYDEEKPKEEEKPKTELKDSEQEEIEMGDTASQHKPSSLHVQKDKSASKRKPHGKTTSQREQRASRKQATDRTKNNKI